MGGYLWALKEMIECKPPFDRLVASNTSIRELTFVHHPCFLSLSLSFSLLLNRLINFPFCMCSTGFALIFSPFFFDIELILVAPVSLLYPLPVLSTFY